MELVDILDSLLCSSPVGKERCLDQDGNEYGEN